MSGSPGNWLLNFTVTDNLGGTNDIYLFGVRLPSSSIAGTPGGWFQPSNSSINWFGYGGSTIEYNNLWITCPAGSCPANYPISVIKPGHALHGFKAVDTAASLPTDISWFAVASGGTYPAPGPGCSFICNAPFDNPGFEGTAFAAKPSVVPIPPSVVLLASAVSLIGWARRRAQR